MEIDCEVGQELTERTMEIVKFLTDEAVLFRTVGNTEKYETLRTAAADITRKFNKIR
jgi:hypothetical protein